MEGFSYLDNVRSIAQSSIQLVDLPFQFGDFLLEIRQLPADVLLNRSFDASQRLEVRIELPDVVARRLEQRDSHVEGRTGAYSHPYPIDFFLGVLRHLLVFDLAYFIVGFDVPLVHMRVLLAELPQTMLGTFQLTLDRRYLREDKRWISEPDALTGSPTFAPRLL